MSGQLSMFVEATLPDTRNAISSRESADGVSRSGLPDGRTIDPSGRLPAHASHTVSPALLMVARKAKAMSGIFGRNFSASSASASLQQFLANKLQARFHGDGGMKSLWILRPKDTPVRRLYCELMPLGGGHERKRLYWLADAGSEGRERYKPVDGLPFAATAAFTINGDPIVRARRALAGDYSDLLLGDGVSVAVERCATKGYGNAIVPQVAAEFIRASNG